VKTKFGVLFIWTDVAPGLPVTEPGFIPFKERMGAGNVLDEFPVALLQFLAVTLIDPAVVTFDHVIVTVVPTLLSVEVLPLCVPPCIVPLVTTQS
jgi:hypothetical protein